MDWFRSTNAGTSRSAVDRGHHKPGLADFLRMLNADVVYHRAAGDFVYYRDEHGNEVEVLDAVGGYGTLLFGHAHPHITAEAIRVLSAAAANHAQGSVRAAANLLADELARRASGDYCVVFANSGAEGVEVALKHALLETGGRKFIAIANAFHGKTLGTLQLSGNSALREPFSFSAPEVIRVKPDDQRALQRAFHATELAGLVFEPIQGEGGVRPLDSDFLKRAAELCKTHNIPLIADECQTGLGRTGHFLASNALGIRPNYIILSKALGGGIAKIAAVLIERRRYRREFDWLHTSTFADDEFSCQIARKTLQLLTDDVLSGCRDKGATLLAALRALQLRYPAALADVRGAGLMVGIQLQRSFPPGSVLLRFLAAHRFLGLLVAAYMLRVHQLRVAPTLSDPFTLRLQPSALVSPEQLQRIVAAMEDVCRRLAENDVLGLTHFLTGAPRAAQSFTALPSTVGEAIAHDPIAYRQRLRRRVVTKVGWLFHLSSPSNLSHFDATFSGLAPSEQEQYARRIAPFCRPVLMNPVDIHSVTGNEVRLFPILLPITPQWIKEQLEMRNRPALQSLVEQGMKAAARLGCSVVSLGQLTSTLTRQGRTLGHWPLGITTGNSYTAALALRAIEQAQHARQLDPATSVLAIVGAAGNIGRICVKMLSPQFRRTIIIGSSRRSAWPRLQLLASRDPRVECSSNRDAVREANVVICAASNVDSLLTTDTFATGSIVCDLSIPHAVADDARNACVSAPTESQVAQRAAGFTDGTWSSAPAAKSGIQLIRGGLARLPCGETVDIPGLPLTAGHVFGCLAEGLALALEGVRDKHFTGPLTESKVYGIEKIAMRHGFQVACSDAAVPFTSDMERPHVGVD